MDASAEAIAPAMLAWYRQHARALPWRLPPGTPPPDDPDWPYRVWLAEVMLQQTTVAAVERYWRAFVARWPSVAALAAAPEAEVLAAWAGLGYYSRARNLHACARVVAARGGRFPETERELRALPGIGAYTAASVAAIAFGQRAAVVDANVERVIARLDAIATPLPQARAEIRARVAALNPARHPGDFAQALMDLGATVCAPRGPRCALCPLAQWCRARTVDPEAFPVKPPKRPRPARTGRAFWIVRQDAVWLVRRPAKGMLAAMRALPCDGWSARGDGAAPPPLSGPWRAGGVVRHQFTHFDLELQLMLYSGAEWASLERKAGEWWPLARLAEAGLPTLFARAAALAVATGERV